MNLIFLQCVATHCVIIRITLKQKYTKIDNEIIQQTQNLVKLQVIYHHY